MKGLLSILLVTILLITGCRSSEVSRASAGLPIRYYNARYDLTFYLPASWNGYSVSIQSVEDVSFVIAQNRQVTVGHTPMITLRHPPLPNGAPYQDISILAFTHNQWDDLHHGKLWPSRFAGGIMDELWHNQRFVFAMSSRYNSDDTVNGWKEVADIVDQNRAANDMPRLYAE